MSSDQDSQPFRWHHTEFSDGNFQTQGRTLFFAAVLFSILLLLTLLVLYARWICLFRLLTYAPHLAQAPPPQPGGLDAATISSFPIILHHSSITTAKADSECCICLGVFENGDKIKVLPKCDHSYHSDCVDNWLRAQSNCPLCRSSLLSSPPV